MDEIMRMVHRAVALDFLASGSRKFRRFIREEEVQIDDPVKFPVGKMVKITVEYVDENINIEDATND